MRKAMLFGKMLMFLHFFGLFFTFRQSPVCQLGHFSIFLQKNSCYVLVKIVRVKKVVLLVERSVKWGGGGAGIHPPPANFCPKRTTFYFRLKKNRL